MSDPAARSVSLAEVEVGGGNRDVRGPEEKKTYWWKTWPIGLAGRIGLVYGVPTLIMLGAHTVGIPLEFPAVIALIWAFAFNYVTKDWDDPDRD